MLEKIAAIASALPDRSIIAIDGVDGAGKTTFANRLKPLIESHGRQVVRAGVDGFHNPKAVRYTRGKSDPLGFFLDSYNYGELTNYLIEPFRKGEKIVQTKRFDHHTDCQDIILESVDTESILVFDGIFLHRDELRNYWNLSIFLKVPFSISYQRMADRDGSDPNPEAESNRRYYRGQLFYLDHYRPEERATLVVEG